MDAEAEALPAGVPWTALGVATVASVALALLLDVVVIPRLVAVPEGAGGSDAPLLAAGGDAFGDAGEDAVAAAASAPRPAASRRRSEAEYRTTILGRYLFDPTKVGKADEGTSSTGEDTGPRLSDLKAMLTGTMVAEPATYSVAFIQEDGKNSAYPYGVGQVVQGAEIVEVLADRVKLRQGTEESWLILGEKPEGGMARGPTTSTAPAGTETSTDGISECGENCREVERGLIDEKLNDLASLAREARALLHRGPDGQYDGYRLSAIRRGSLPDQLGIRNGDIIHSVNGMPLSSVDGAMKALEALRTEGGLKFEVTRRGQPVSLDYTIR